MFTLTHWSAPRADVFLRHEQVARLRLHASPWQTAGVDLARFGAALLKGSDHVAS